jgi:hypothetical protein
MSQGYDVNSFTGHAGGSKLDLTLISEYSAYSSGNRFGVVDGANTFTEFFSGSATTGATASLNQSAAQQFTFSLINAVGQQFYSVASMNSDKARHLIAFVATSTGTLNIPQSSTLGTTAPISIPVTPGMLAFFVEDLPWTGPGSSDIDFNDLVGVVKQTQVPEPATMLLLGSSAFFAIRRKRT